ncbi:MAG: sigma-70 family RNA polymerase sigma factor [Polyangiaceae bacterium]
MPSTPNPTLSRYIGLVNAFPKLSRDDELALWQRWHDYQDDRAKDALIQANLRYVVALALKYRSYSIPLAELIAEGNFGIFHALSKFDPNRGNRFVTYAACWIRAFILNYIIRSWSMVGGGSGPLHSRLFFKLRRERTRIYSLVGEGELADALLAERVGLPQERIAEFNQRLATRDVSLDRQVFSDGSTSLGEMLESPQITQEEAYLDIQDEFRMTNIVRCALDSLDKREKQVVQEYLMSDDDNRRSLAEIGRSLGVSRERARQLESRAKKKLRQRILEISDVQLHSNAKSGAVMSTQQPNSPL